MRPALALAAVALTAAAAFAERRDVTQMVDDKVARITEADGLEVLSVGRSERDTMEILSGADVEIVAVADGPDNAALFGAAVIVVEVSGTQSCMDGDPQEYYVVKLGLFPGDPEGPLTTCGRLAVTVADGMVTLAADPGSVEAASWTWTPATGFSAKAN
jgi:hypothetical protein